MLLKASKFTIILLCLNLGRLAAMEQKSLVKEKKVETADINEEQLEETLRNRELLEQLAIRNAKKNGSGFIIPFISWQKMLAMAPIVSDIYGQLDEPFNPDPRVLRRIRERNIANINKLISSFIDCIEFDKIPLQKFIHFKDEEDYDSKGKFQLLSFDVVVTDIFDEILLKQFLTNFVIDIKNFWQACSEKVNRLVLSEDEKKSYSALCLEEIKKVWAVHKKNLVKRYDDLLNSIDSNKIDRLEQDCGKITLTSFVTNMKDVFEHYIEVKMLDADSAHEIIFETIPFIGHHLEHFLHSKAVTELYKLINDAQSIAKLNRNDVINKALDCIKFDALLPGIKSKDSKTSEESQRVRVINEEGCRVLLKLLFEMHSNKEDSATFAVNRLLFILGEHSLQEKAKKGLETSSKPTGDETKSNEPNSNN